jgi:hypothetical protein
VCKLANSGVRELPRALAVLAGWLAGWLAGSAFVHPAK